MVAHLRVVASPRSPSTAAAGDRHKPSAVGEGMPTDSIGAGGLRAGRGGEGEGRVATREKCPQCGAVFGDVGTLINHVERFHPKVSDCLGTLLYMCYMCYKRARIFVG